MTLRLLTDGLPVAPLPAAAVARTSDGVHRASLRIRQEPVTRADWKAHDYNLHFCFGVENCTDGAVEAEISVDGGSWDALPATAPVLYEAPSATGPFRPSPREARTDLKKRYAIRIRLAPREIVYFANHLPIDAMELLADCDALAAATGGRRQSIGTSVEGRDIVSYTFGDPATLGTVLVTSGFHPPEPDSLVSSAIMRWLASGGVAALSNALAIVVVPIMNPDGFARGSQAANANGINFYWDFARDRPELCPEAAALWSLASALKPRGYLDIHGYTFQRNKEWGPYVRPGLFHTDPHVRRAASSIYDRILSGGRAHPVTGFAAYAPQTLGSMLAEEFDTVTLAKFHVHLKEGVDAVREQGVFAFRALAEGLIEAGLTSPGARVHPGWRTPVRRGLEYWSGFMRPSLGLVRRGRPGEIPLQRCGLVAP